MNTHKGTLGRGTNNQPSGDHSAEDPPVPIPNTAVKLRSADDTPAPGRGKVGHRQILQDDRPAHKGGPIAVLGAWGKGEGRRVCEGFAVACTLWNKGAVAKVAKC